MQDIKQQMTNFKEYYYYQLSPENREILDWFSTEEYSLDNAFKKAFYPKRIRNRLIDDFMIRIVFLMGVL